MTGRAKSGRRSGASSCLFGQGMHQRTERQVPQEFEGPSGKSDLCALRLTRQSDPRLRFSGLQTYSLGYLDKQQDSDHSSAI